MTDAISTSAASAGAAAQKQAALVKAATQFEAIFMRQIIGAMRSATASEGDDLFGSSAGDQFRDLSDARLADSMAARGLGIAQMLLRQFGAHEKPAAAAPAQAAE